MTQESIGRLLAIGGVLIFMVAFVLSILDLVSG